MDDAVGSTTAREVIGGYHATGLNIFPTELGNPQPTMVPTFGVPGPVDGTTAAGDFFISGVKLAAFRVDPLPPLPTPMREWTFEAWTKSNAPQQQTIALLNNPANFFHGDTLIFRIGWTGPFFNGRPFGQLFEPWIAQADGRWHHWAMTNDGNGTFTLYRDGAVFAVDDQGYPGFTFSPTTLTFACSLVYDPPVWDIGSAFEGDLAHIALYDRALTADEVARHVASGGRTGPPGPQGPQGPLGTYTEVAPTPPNPSSPLIVPPQGFLWVDTSTDPLTGPQGAQGPRGFQGEIGGPGLIWRGAWSDTANYVANDVVMFRGSAFVSLQNNFGTHPLMPIPGAWDLLAQGLNWTGNWQEYTTYYPSDLVRIGRNVYICRQLHVSATDPFITPGRWDLFAEGPGRPQWGLFNAEWTTGGLAILGNFIAGVIEVPSFFVVRVTGWHGFAGGDGIYDFDIHLADWPLGYGQGLNIGAGGATLGIFIPANWRLPVSFWGAHDNLPVGYTPNVFIISNTTIGSWFHINCEWQIIPK
jgi:hypothetical protein